MINRVTILIMDSVGIGALPDSEKFGDVGVNTLGNISKVMGGMNLPNLIKLGLGNIDGIEGVDSAANPIGAYGKSMEISNGKDTTTGHWEIAGLYIKEPFNTYPEGFPESIISKFEELTGKKVLGNKTASGTEIIEELGEEHMKTGNPIMYTSADSVFQIAAHEEVISLDELYKMCSIARDILRGEDQVARVIARPFVGELGSFVRTANRRDYSLDPFEKTILDYAVEGGYDVMAVGKIEDIFNKKGITRAVHTKNNMDGVDKTIEYLDTNSKGIIFTNLVDFDSKFGHRRNPKGYKEALEELDVRIPEILNSLKDNDMLVIMADHGNDPTYKGTDHTREYVPVLVYGKNVKAGVNLGIRKTFADIAVTIADILNIEKPKIGTSFKELIIK